MTRVGKGWDNGGGRGGLQSKIYTFYLPDIYTGNNDPTTMSEYRNILPLISHPLIIYIYIYISKSDFFSTMLVLMRPVAVSLERVVEIFR